MPVLLSLDQLQTLVAIAERGTFTRAAEHVCLTPQAVSMQMRRLEDRVGISLFAKQGRLNRLTEDGELMLTFARQMLQLNREILELLQCDSASPQLKARSIG